jgi:hypothetical protein
VAQQGGTGEFMRDRALEALASLSINDDYFLTHIRDNLEPTLWEHAFALSPSEMRIVKAFSTKLPSTVTKISLTA